MKRIFKYELKIVDGVQTIELPKGHRILKYGTQPSDSVGGFETPVFWALIDDEVKSMDKIDFRIAGTGHPIDYLDDFVWIDTVIDTSQMPSGLVWHIFRGKS